MLPRRSRTGPRRPEIEWARGIITCERLFGSRPACTIDGSPAPSAQGGAPATSAVSRRELRYLKRLLKSIADNVLSEGERAALTALAFEFRVSSGHRKGLRLIRQHGWQRPKRLNLGSGESRKQGFLNVDLQRGGDLVLDLRRGLPFEDNSCELIFSEHFLEHVEYPEAIGRLLRECLRILQPGGRLTFSVPDTEWALRDYVLGDAAPYFQACREHSWWHPTYCTTRLEHINYHFRQDGQHLFAYDFETMKKILEQSGFAEVAVREFDPHLDSEHRRIGSLFGSASKAT